MKTSMKGILPASIMALLLSACGASTGEKAEDLLEEARIAVSEERYDDARMLIDSLRSTFPKETDSRREALAFTDTLELREAESLLRVADSVEIFKQLELEDAKTKFVFEKQEKYQSQGYYVLPQHAGNKTRLTFFPEVEESGKMLLVTIDSKRHYDFHEVSISPDGKRDYSEVELTEQQAIEANQCYELAYSFLLYNNAKQVKEELDRKVKFYQLKIEKRNAGQ